MISSVRVHSAYHSGLFFKKYKNNLYESLASLKTYPRVTKKPPTLSGEGLSCLLGRFLAFLLHLDEFPKGELKLLGERLPRGTGLLGVATLGEPMEGCATDVVGAGDEQLVFARHVQCLGTGEDLELLEAVNLDDGHVLVWVGVGCLIDSITLN